MLVRNVATGVATPKLQHREVAALTPAEMHQLFDAVVDGRNNAEHRLRPLFIAACYLGCRQGELLALKWSDIDWTARKVTIQRNLVRVAKGEPVFGPPKTRAGHRTFTIPRPALEALRAHRDKQGFERKTAGATYRDLGLVFCSPLGTPMAAQRVIKLFEASRDRAGLPEQLTFHALRHTCASMLIAAGVPLPEVAQILGHATPQVTATIYAHIVARSSEHAADRLERWINEQTATSAEGSEVLSGSHS